MEALKPPARISGERESLLYDVAGLKHAQQLQSIGQLDTKIQGVTGFATALIAALGLIFPLAGTSEGASHKFVFGVLLLGGIATYGYVLYALWRGYRPRSTWSWGPELADVEVKCDEYDLHELHHWLARMYRQSIDENRPLLDDKAAHLHRGMIAVGIETLIIAVTGFSVLFFR